MAALDHIDDCLRDIDPEFLSSACIAAAWEYRRLFDELAENLDLSDEYRSEQFNRRRGDCLVKALCFAAKKHGVPFEFLKLGSNGQAKLLLKCGRVTIIQEPILSLKDAPRAADYKLELANAHGVVRQLELDLGDLPGRVLDWDGRVLGVVLHGPAGQHFDEEDRALGTLMLGIPDAAYSHWVVRVDLHNVAMEGLHIHEPDPAPTPPDDSTQPDNVNVTLKRNSKKAV